MDSYDGKEMRDKEMGLPNREGGEERWANGKGKKKMRGEIGSLLTYAIQPAGTMEPDASRPISD